MKDKAQDLYDAKKKELELDKQYEIFGILSFLGTLASLYFGIFTLFFSSIVISPIVIILGIISLFRLSTKKFKGWWLPICAICVSIIELLVVIIVILAGGLV